MKTNHFFLGACLLFASLCVSCKQNTPEVVDWNAIRSTLENYGDYTYSNYSLNERLFFLLETQLGKEYKVVRSEIATVFAQAESESEAGQNIESMSIEFSMCNRYNTAEEVNLKGYCPNNNPNEIAWVFGIETPVSSSVKNAKPAFDIAADEIYIENEAGQWMVLKKGVGISKMGDKNGHTWEKMKN